MWSLGSDISGVFKVKSMKKGSLYATSTLPALFYAANLIDLTWHSTFNKETSEKFPKCHVELFTIYSNIKLGPVHKMHLKVHIYLFLHTRKKPLLINIFREINDIFVFYFCHSLFSYCIRCTRFTIYLECLFLIIFMCFVCVCMCVNLHITLEKFLRSFRIVFYVNQSTKVWLKYSAILEFFLLEIFWDKIPSHFK